tara:strand:- start:121 stop:597 length:477 start_codon:yes stop_codon:yes gene_type:complete
MNSKSTMLKNVKTDYYLNFVKDDPVRPHLPTFWRVQPNREVYVLEDDETNELQAMICVAYTNEVPKDEGELEQFSTPSSSDDRLGNIAVFYTVWSYKPGSGREIVLGLAKLIKDTLPVTRFVTMSPMTEMARRFHLKNGASVLQVNSTSVNYEYKFEE